MAYFLYLTIKVLLGYFKVSEGAGKVLTQLDRCACSIINLFELIKNGIRSSPNTPTQRLPRVAHLKRGFQVI